MPGDTTYDNNKLQEYQSVLDEIDRLVIECDVHTVVLSGDWNTDFSRETSLFSKAYNAKGDFACALECKGEQIDYTFLSKASGSK